MNQIQVNLNPEAASAGSVKDLTGCIPDLVKEWESRLSESCARGDEQFFVSYYKPSEIHSQNFSVIGMQLRTINSFLRTHEFPRTIVILCDSRNTAEIYKQIFNFYIADSKENGLILTPRFVP